MRPSATDDQGNDGAWHRLWRKGNGKGWLKHVVHILCQDHPLAISADFLIPIVLLLLIQGDGLRSSLLGRYFGTNYHFRIGRDANSKSLIDSNSKKTASQMVNSGPGAEMLSRAGVTLCEMQGRLDKCGASDLIIDLIMVQPNLRVFLEILELAIALLEGGNNSIQVGNYLGSQEFYDFGHEKGDVCDHVTTRLLPTRGLSVRSPHHSRLASFFSRVCSRNQRFLLRLIIFAYFLIFLFWRNHCSIGLQTVNVKNSSDTSTTKWETLRPKSGRQSQFKQQSQL